MDHDPRQLRIERILARGPAHFLFWRGFVGWGLTTGVLWAFLVAWLRDKPVGPFFTIGVIVFPLGGVLWGLWMWRWMVARAGGGSPRRQSPPQASG